jgi:hypothetical protein
VLQWWCASDTLVVLHLRSLCFWAAQIDESVLEKSSSIPARFVLTSCSELWSLPANMSSKHTQQCSLACISGDLVYQYFTCVLNRVPCSCLPQYIVPCNELSCACTSALFCTDSALLLLVASMSGISFHVTRSHDVSVVSVLTRSFGFAFCFVAVYRMILCSCRPL